MLMLETCRA